MAEQQKAVVIRGTAPQKADARLKANRATERQRRDLAHEGGRAASALSVLPSKLELAVCLCCC
jgi:3-methyladenine DNA glycosylase Mpg